MNIHTNSRTLREEFYLATNTPMPAPNHHPTKTVATLRPHFLSLTLLLFCVLTMNIPNSQAEVLAPHLHKRKFDNGMTLLVKEIPGSKAATVQIWIKTGSVYEDDREAGITHLIEHMIFKGTPTHGPGQVAGAIEEVGGRINAYTSFEYTVYHATLSSRHWQLALEVLTDAVLHSTFDPAELEREKLVVLEELGMRNDRPNIRLFQELMTASYTAHPYRLPVIGTLESVSSFTRDDILAYMGKHYQPENITVVIVGDVQAELVARQVSDQLGGLSGGRYQAPKLPVEPVQTSSRFFRLEQDVNQSSLALSFPIPSFNHPDAAVLDVIAGILGEGDSSRLYHRLRDQQGLVYRIDASAFTPRDPGLMEVTATLAPDKITEALTSILEEFFTLKYLSIEDDELTRVKRNLESDFVFSLEQVEGQARIMGSFDFLTGDPREHDYLEQIRAVTKDDVKRAARTYFNEDKITAGILVPKNSTGTAIDLPAIIHNAEDRAKSAVPPSLIDPTYLPNIHRFHLDNGITLLVREDPSVPTVAIRAVFPGGLRGENSRTNGAFAFITDLLPRGAAGMNARDIALKVADMAGDITGFNGKNTFGLKADFLARFATPGLKLVRDIIREPAFDRQEADKLRPELLDQLKQQEDSLTAVAFREFSRLLFAGHPYSLNTVGSKTAIERFTVDELKKIYQDHAQPDNLILAVSGDVKAAEVETEVRALFGGWIKTSASVSPISEEGLPPTPPATPKVFTIDRDKEQTHIIIGFLGASLKSPDRFAVEVLDTILSGQSGRLFTELRDKQSLAYSLSSFSMVGLDTGAFGLYIGTSPDKKTQAVAALWRELEKARVEQVSEAELNRAKNILISNYELGLQTHSAQALEMALNETYGLGQNFGNQYAEAIAQVDVAAVQAAAQKYLLPDHYVHVEAGAQAKPAPPVPTAEAKTPLATEPKAPTP